MQCLLDAYTLDGTLGLAILGFRLAPAATVSRHVTSWLSGSSLTWSCALSGEKCFRSRGLATSIRRSRGGPGVTVGAMSVS